MAIMFKKQFSLFQYYDNVYCYFLQAQPFVILPPYVSVLRYAVYFKN